MLAIAIAAYVVVLFRLEPVDTVPGLDRPVRFQGTHPIELYELFFRPGRLLDTYAGFYPNTVYALRAARDGGHGLWWNPYQSCGQPFFGRTTAALVYPLNGLLPFLIGADLALWMIPFLNLVVAGVFAYLLCRELGIGQPGALCGTAAFALSNAVMEATVWQPHVIGTYAWVPAALLFCERTLRAPKVAHAIGLGVALALPLVAGFPQVAVYIYQLVALRVVWELVTLRAGRPVAVALAVGSGAILAPLLASVQLIPAWEVAQASIRSGAALSPGEISPGGLLGWGDLRLAVEARASVFQPFFLVGCMLATVALLAPATRRRALTYGFLGLVFFVLALGPITPLWDWYAMLPGGRTFRWPQVRLMSMVSIAVAVLTALGVEAVGSGGSAGSRWRTVAAVAGMGGALAGFHLLTLHGLRPTEWALAALVVLAVAVTGAAPAARGAAAVVLLGAVVTNLAAVPVGAWKSPLYREPPVYAHEGIFTRLRARMTAQDRVQFSFGTPFESQFSLVWKSASLFEVPTLQDYEPHLSKRYVQLTESLRLGHPVRESPISPLGFPPAKDGQGSKSRRRLLDLTAARYLLVASAHDDLGGTDGTLVPLEEEGGVRLYENTRALARARFVPGIEVVPDEDALLQRLISGEADPRRVALVAADLPSGFRGASDTDVPNQVHFVRNDPEHLVIRVSAAERGFLLLADEYFPGWTATVDGRPTPIARANHAFRLVEVPAGESTVEFRYAPWTVRLGAWVSGLTLLGVGATLALSVARRRSPGPIAARAVPPGGS